MYASGLAAVFFALLSSFPYSKGEEESGNGAAVFSHSIQILAVATDHYH